MTPSDFVKNLNSFQQAIFPAQFSLSSLNWIRERNEFSFLQKLPNLSTSQFHVVVDESPVFADLPEFHAQFNHKLKEIRVNGYLLKRCAHPELLLQFLVWHECFHFLVKQQFSVLKEFHPLSEEDAADVYAYGMLFTTREWKHD